MRTELAASTVTPGSTAPDASLTTPVMAPCANAAAGRSKTAKRATANLRASIGIACLLRLGGGSAPQDRWVPASPKLRRSEGGRYECRMMELPRDLGRMVVRT